MKTHTSTPPKIEVKLTSEIMLTANGKWFPVFYASCIFESIHGEKFEPIDKLDKEFPMRVTDFLLKRHKENGFFVDTKSERKRLSCLIAKKLDRQAEKIRTQLLRYGYPTRFVPY